MGLYIVDKDGKFDHWEWEGSVRELVRAVGNGDARLGFVVDRQSGAKISMNMNDVPEPGYKGVFEPFYIESPDGETMYDAYNRREAITLLSNIRKGMKYPDMGVASSFPAKWQRPQKTAKGKKGKAPSRASVRGLI